VENKASDYIREEEIGEKILNSEGPGKTKNNFFDILKTKTGEGSIEFYNEHPLNFNHSLPISQIIRGATGFFGALDLAIIDIMLGIFQLFMDKRSLKDV